MKLFCKLFGHRYLLHDEAALLRALAWDKDARFCDRCGFNTIGMEGSQI